MKKLSTGTANRKAEKTVYCYFFHVKQDEGSAYGYVESGYEVNSLERYENFKASIEKDSPGAITCISLVGTRPG